MNIWAEQDASENIFQLEILCQGMAVIQLESSWGIFLELLYISHRRWVPDAESSSLERL